MAFGAELTARLKLNITDFERGLASAAHAGDKFGSVLDRKLGLKAAFKGVFAGLGLGIAHLGETIAEVIVGGTKEGFARAGQLFEQEAKLLQQRVLLGLNDKQKRAVLEKDRTRAVQELRDASKTQGRFSRALGLPFKGGRFDFPGAVHEMFSGPTEADRLESMGVARQDLAETELELARLNKKEAEEKAKAEKEYAASSEKLLNRRISNIREQLPLERQIEELKKDIVNDLTAANKLADWTKEKNEALLAVDEKRHQLTELTNKALEKRTQEAEKEATHRKKIADLEERVAEAAGKVADAKQNLADRKRDRFALGFEEARSGERGTPTDRAMAERIQRLQDRARRVFGGGGTLAADDGSGRTVTAEDYARQLFSQADALRNASGRLKSDDRDPLRGVAESIKESERHLREIMKDLASEKIK